MPMLMSLILSTYCISFLHRAYDILIHIFNEMKSISKILTTDYLGFSKIQHYKLPYIKKSAMLDQKVYQMHILDEF